MRARRFGVAATVVLLVASTALAVLGEAPASAATIIIPTEPTSTASSFEAGTATNGQGQTTDLVSMSAALWLTTPITVYVNGTPSELSALANQTVYFSVQASNGIWFPFCQAQTNSQGIAACAGQAPSIYINGVKDYWPLSAWSAVYQGTNVYSTSSDYGRIPGSPTPQPTPLNNGGIKIVANTYASGCQPTTPSQQATLGTLLTDGGNCQLIQIEQYTTTAVFAVATAVISGGLDTIAEIIADADLADAIEAANLSRAALGLGPVSTSVSGGLADLAYTVGALVTSTAATAAFNVGLLRNIGTFSIPSGDFLSIGSGTTLSNAGTIDNLGTITDGSSTNDGAGVIDNTGIIVNQGTISGNGQGNGGLLILGHNYTLNFDLNGGSGSTPAALQVFAEAVDASQQALPNPTASAGEEFTGWYTAATGGSLVTNGTDLSNPALLGSGPSSMTLYAHYQPIADVTLYVDPSGTSSTCTGPGTGACPTLAVAIATATGGGYAGDNVAIDVGAGTYDETETITAQGLQSLTIVGAGAVDTAVDAQEAGSVFVINSGTVIISDLAINDGQAPTTQPYGGGGVSNSSGTVTLTGDTLANDSTGQDQTGGGVFNGAGGTMVLTNDTLSGDSAGAGGGVDNNGGSVTLTNDTLVGDSASVGGGGVVSTGGTLILTDDTLSDDSAPSGAGVIASGNANATVSDSILDVAGCTVSSNSTVTDGGYNVESDNSCGFGSTSVVNSSSINLADSLSSNGSAGPETLALGAGSSALGEVPLPAAAAAGKQGCAVTTDERGLSRPGVAGQSCDAGAFEAQAPAATVPGAPSGVAASAGVGQATVSWSAPTNNGGSPVSGYAVTATDIITPGNGGQICSPSPATSTTCTVGGLTGGDAYTFAVTAKNSVGTGASSPASSAVVIKAVPSLGSVVDDASSGSSWSESETQGASAYDTASLYDTVGGLVPTGTVTYRLFDNSTCSSSAASTQTVTLGDYGVVPDSANTAALSPGSYSYQAAYSGDSNYASVTGLCESFAVATTPVPAVSGISPASGSPLGGTSVTVTGSGFTGATKVVFGHVAALTFTVVSDSEITAVSPPQAAATHGILVTTPGGTTPVVKAGYFVYKVPVPAVTSISPTSGPIAGGTTVTVTGTGFTGATAVTFGHVAASSFTVVSDTEITAVSPPQGAGTHGILVTTSGGTTPVVSAGYFVYKTPVPAVTSISPASGPITGGTTVIVTGTGFTGAMSVTFGHVAASSFTVVSDTEIMAVSPPQAAATHGILVTTSGGTTPVVKAGYFVYTATAPNVPASSPGSFADLADTAPAAVQRSSWFRAAW